MKRWIVVGWMLFGLSFFLPVGHGSDTLADGHIPGWDAVKAAVNFGGAYGVLSALTNLLMLASVLMMRSLNRGFIKVTALVLAVSALWNTIWFIRSDAPGDFLSGYYVWVMSFGVAAFGFWRGLRSKPSLPFAQSLPAG